MVKWIPIIIVGGLGVLVGGGVWFEIATQNRCPGHWHASFEYVVDGHRVDFADPHFYLEGRSEGVTNAMPLSTHVHKSNSAEWHFEPSPSACIPFENANRYVGVTLRENGMTLTGAHDAIVLQGSDPPRMQGGTYTEEGNRTLTAYHQLPGDPWSQISIRDLNKRQLRDGERLLVLFGHYTDDEVRSLQNAAPTPSTYASGQQAQGNQVYYPPA